MCQASGLIKDLHFKFTSLPAPPHSALFPLPSCFCVQDLLSNAGGRKATDHNNLAGDFWRGGEVVCECTHVFLCIQQLAKLHQRTAAFRNNSCYHIAPFSMDRCFMAL